MWVAEREKDVAEPGTFLAIDEEGGILCFSGGGDDGRDDGTDSMDGAVDGGGCITITKVEYASCHGSRGGAGKVGGVRLYVENHITGCIAERVVRKTGTVFQKTVGSLKDLLCGVSLE